MRRFSWFPVLLAVLACGTTPGADTAPAAAGHLFIVGGGRRSPELMARFVELAGGQGAHIVVFPMASATPAGTGEAQAAELRALGADARSVVLTRDDASDDGFDTGFLDDAGGIWFPGGSQSRLTDVLQGTPVLDAIRRRYREGAVVGGTSAGAAVMSAAMITGSQRDPEGDTLAYLGDTFARLERDMMELAHGFGLLTSAIVDQHFLRRERQNRLLATVLSHPDLIGVGIDEATAVIVRPDGLWEVAGASAALVYDARNATVTGNDAPVLGATGVRLSVLPPGSVYDPSRGLVVGLGRAP